MQSGRHTRLGVLASATVCTTGVSWEETVDAKERSYHRKTSSIAGALLGGVIWVSLLGKGGLALQCGNSPVSCAQHKRGLYSAAACSQQRVPLPMSLPCCTGAWEHSSRAACAPLPGDWPRRQVPQVPAVFHWAYSTRDQGSSQSQE